MGSKLVNLVNKVRETIKKYNLLSYGDKIIVAFSGGPDSVVLIDILTKLKDEFNLQIKAFHLNHQIRKNAIRDEEFCINFCKNRNLEIIIARENIKKFSKKNKLSLEEAGRIVRYRLLMEELTKNKFDKIATAHHLDDNIETLFLRMFKGTSLEGLKIIKPKNKKIIRPLIECSKEEIMEYLEKNHLPFVIDETNLESEYERNYIRLEIIPRIEAKFPYYRNHLRELIEDFREIYKFINYFTKRYFRKSVELKNNEAIIDLSKLPSFSDFLTLEVLKKALKRLNFLPSRKILKIILLNIKERKGNKYIVNTKKISILREYDKLIIKENKEKEDFFKEFYINDIKLEIFINDNLSFEILDNNTLTFSKIKEDAKKGISYIDLSDTKKVIIRNRKKGDTILLKGFRRKLKDIFINDKTPLSTRERAIVVEVNGEIASIFYGKVRISDNFLVKENSKKILKIAFNPYLQ